MFKSFSLDNFNLENIKLLDKLRISFNKRKETATVVLKRKWYCIWIAENCDFVIKNISFGLPLRHKMFMSVISYYGLDLVNIMYFFSVVLSPFVLLVAFETGSYQLRLVLMSVCNKNFLWTPNHPLLLFLISKAQDCRHALVVQDSAIWQVSE